MNLSANLLIYNDIYDYHNVWKTVLSTQEQIFFL